MKCTSKEQDTCNVEKMECKGCYYSIGIDYGKGESKSAISRKIEMTETDKRIKELQQYEYNKDKIEIGEWVRNNGEIGIVKNILKNKKTFLVVEWQNKEKSFYLEYSKYYENKDNKTIDLKHSKNIIDLIEVDDYVNGYRVIGILTNKVNRKKLINVGGKLFNNNDIKSIVTKERFKAIEYKIQ